MVSLNLSASAPTSVPLLQRAVVEGDQPTFDDYSAFTRRHIRLLLACMQVGLMVGVLWAALQPSTYSATASVILSPVPSYVSLSSTGRLPREVTIDTDAHLVQSPTVLAAVSASVEEHPQSVLRNLRVTAVPLSRVLQITYTSDSPAEAAEGSTVAAESFIAVRTAALGALQQDQLSQLSLRITELQDRLDAEMRRKPFVPPDDPLATEVALLRSRFVDLQRAQASPAEIIRRPAPPTSPNPSNPEVPLTSGLLLGLLGGCLAGRLWDHLQAPSLGSPVAEAGNWQGARHVDSRRSAGSL